MRQISPFPKTRLRRLRQSHTLRRLVKETYLEINKLIQPLFIHHGTNIKNPIASMPGQFQLSVDQLRTELKSLVAAGIRQVILFGIPEYTDALGSSAYQDDGVIQLAIKEIKQHFPELLVLTDLCFCEYMDHGHCGYIHSHDTSKEAQIDNDATLALLVKQAVSHAHAGADIIAPSGCVDGMVHALREGLDGAGFLQIPILSYSVKYASAMYGPFRQAAGDSAPKFGDRQTYQMDMANSNEALRECMLDVAEGADILMVKPAHTYLDVIFKIKQAYPELPLCAYHTSGEFAMIKAAAQQGWVDERRSVLEVLTSIRRAGADMIITYYAKDVAEWLTTEARNS